MTHHLASRLSPWFFAIGLAWASITTAGADPAAPSRPDPSTSSQPAATASAAPAPVPDDADAFLERALDLERKRNWPGAIQVYHEALERWPSRIEFTHRRRLCESHYRLTRRYQDQSFRTVLLRLPREKAIDLLDEVLDRIESHYVDAVPLEPLIRGGLDNLEIALRDPNFLRLNHAESSPERVKWLRDVLRTERQQLHVSDRAKARATVLATCDQAARGIGLGPAAVILEFAYGACDALDDYTSYLTPDKLEDLYAMIDGNFVGLGVELKADPKGLRIVGVIRGGPASEAGMKAGDIITHVNGQSVQGQGLDEAASKLQGSEGTAVAINILHPNGSATAYKLARRHVEVESVPVARIVDPANGIGYVQLTGFQKTSAEELDKAIASLRGQGMKTLVLDLRGNPGGLLNVAVEIAERFIAQGVIVSTRGRATGQSQIYRAHGRVLWTLPLITLIDHDSASASEILAGALKDHGRATIMGERSYGKGSVQSIFALRAAPAGLKLTTAKFYSPESRPYSEQGVEPDIAVKAVAKPADTSHRPGADLTLGDPELDPVLQQAIRQARRPR